MIAELIINNSKDREIVFWGGWDNNELIRKVEQKKKIKFVAVSPKDVKCERKIEHIATLSGKSDRCYVVVFPKETQEIHDMFTKFGWTEENLFFVYHKPVLAQKDGMDKYGNVIKGIEKYGQKVQCYLEGYGANVFLGDEINIGCKLKINVGNESIVSIADKCVFSENFSVIARNLNENKYSKIRIEENCRFISGRIASFGGRINLGSDSSFGKDFVCASGYDMTVNIGTKCMFSHEIYVYAGDGHTLFDTKNNKVINSVSSMRQSKKEIVIGEHVWVGLRSIIMNGTDIGSGSMLGAVSFVKSKYPNNCMVAGNPAKILKKNIAWSRNPVPIDNTEMYQNEEEYYKMTIDEGAS